MILPSSKPSRDATADYDFARSKRRRTAVRQHLADVRDDVLDAYDRYVENGGRADDTTKLDIGDEVKDALRKNFGLTAPGSPMGHLREYIFQCAFRRTCPMCGYGQVLTLDHYLPKDAYPEFSILPLNLVPACSDCNNFKSNFIRSTEGARFIHPYFDDISSLPPLLKATIGLLEDGVSIDFSANDELPPDVRANTSAQVDKLRLADRYSWAGNQELFHRVGSLAEEYCDGGWSAVAALARRRSAQLSRSHGRHYWMSALYSGVSRSREFCDEGFEVLRASPSYRR